MGGAEFQVKAIAQEQAVYAAQEAEAKKVMEAKARTELERWNAVVPALDAIRTAEGGATLLAAAWKRMMELRRVEGALAHTGTLPGAAGPAAVPPGEDQDLHVFVAGSGDVTALGNFLLAAGGYSMGSDGHLAPLLPDSLSVLPVPVYLGSDTKGYSVHAVASRAALREALSRAVTEAWLDAEAGWVRTGVPYDFGDLQLGWEGTLGLLAWDSLAELLPALKGVEDAEQVAEALRGNADALVDLLATKLCGTFPGLQEANGEETEVKLELLPCTSSHDVAASCLQALAGQASRFAWSRLEVCGPFGTVQAMQESMPASSSSRAWLVLAAHSEEVKHKDAPAFLPRKLAALETDVSALMLVQGERTKGAGQFLRAALRYARANVHVCLVNSQDDSLSRPDWETNMLRELRAVVLQFAENSAALQPRERAQLRELSIRSVLARRGRVQAALSGGHPVSPQEAAELGVCNLLGSLCGLRRVQELSNVRALKAAANDELQASAQLVDLPPNILSQLYAFSRRGNEANNERDNIEHLIMKVAGSEQAVRIRWEHFWGGKISESILAELEKQRTASRAVLGNKALSGQAAAEALEREFSSVIEIYRRAADEAWKGFVNSYLLGKGDPTPGTGRSTTPQHQRWMGGATALAVDVSNADLMPSVREWLNDRAKYLLDGRAQLAQLNLFRVLAPKPTEGNPLLRWRSAYIFQSKNSIGPAGPTDQLASRLRSVKAGSKKPLAAFEELLGEPADAQTINFMVRMRKTLSLNCDDIIEPASLRTSLIETLRAAHKERGEIVQRAEDARKVALQLGKEVPGLCGHSTPAQPLSLNSLPLLCTDKQAEQELKSSCAPPLSRYLEHMKFCQVYIPHTEALDHCSAKTRAKETTKGKKPDGLLVTLYPKTEVQRACADPNGLLASDQFPASQQLSKFIECCEAFFDAADQRDELAGNRILARGAAPPAAAVGGGADAAASDAAEPATTEPAGPASGTKRRRL